MRLPLWKLVTISTAVIAAAAAGCLTLSTSNEGTGVRNLRRFYVRVLKDGGDLTSERRQALNAARTEEDLHSAMHTIDDEILAKITNFDGARAYKYLKTLCEFGPRRSGSAAMLRQQEWLKKHFESAGGKVEFQEFDRNFTQRGRPQIRDPEQNGAVVTCRNIIVRWNPEARNRVMLCAHYDTRPYPDEERDPQRARGVFVGANDGASGVALLCELANQMKSIRCGYGVDFVLFDAEELIFEDHSMEDFFLGSTYFAQQYANDTTRNFIYHAAILLDMVGDRHLELFREKNSMRYARRMVDEVWAIAKEAGIKEFRHDRPRHEVRDDHLPLNEIAKIPAIDIIDFDYPSVNTPVRQQYWHTQKDIPENCSPVALARVGVVIRSWLERIRAK